MNYFCQHVFLFCATLNTFSQHESFFFLVPHNFFYCHSIFFCDSLIFGWQRNIFFLLNNTTFFCATHAECEIKECRE